MTEIINIFFILFTFLALSAFPLNIYNQKFTHSIGVISIFDLVTLNLLLNIFALFVISFIVIDYSKIYISLLFFSISTNLFYFFSKKKYFKFFLNKEFIFFILISFIIFSSIARSPILSWDGIENWFFKAQFFFYNYNFFDLRESRGINYYPHLGTFLWGFFWKNSILQYEYTGRLIYIYIFLLSIFSISDLLYKNNFIKLFFSFFTILLCFDNFLFSGYQEVLLFSFLIFLSKYIYIYFLNEKRLILLVCFLILNLIPWIKNEGYLFVIIFTLSLSLLIGHFKIKKDILIFILFSWTLLIVKNFIFYKFLSFNPAHMGSLIFSFNFFDIFNLVFLIIQGLVIAFFKYKIWLLIIGSFIFYRNYNFSTKQKFFIKFLKINLIFYLLLIFVIYFSVINDFRGLNWWIDNSLDRLLYGISGFFIIQIILVTKYYKNYNLK